MREHLIGYLLDALDPAEHEMVEARLSRDPQLQHELQVIARGLAPLAIDKGHLDPPAALAHRTCQFVAEQTRVTPSPAPAHVSSRWTLTDLVVAAGIFIAATMLFFPALSQNRFAARLLDCQNNLREIGMALTTYSNQHQGYFPDIPRQGRFSAAGVYATKLVENGFLESPHYLVCPASAQADRVHEFRVPTSREILIVPEASLAVMQAQMGGSYGYSLGHLSNGVYRSTRNLGRSTFAIMADAPCLMAPFHSTNHGGRGQNVLFEDGHVQYMTTCKARGCNDNIFLNDKGEVACGMHVDDAVVGASHCKPVPAAATVESDR